MKSLPLKRSFVLLSALSFVSYAMADEWAQFRHDAQHTAATSEQMNSLSGIRWKRGFAQIPHVFAELSVVGGRVYLANMDGKITCMDGDTGNTLWEYDTGAPITTTPAVVGGRCHLVNLAGRLITFDAATGSILWEYTMPSTVNGVFRHPNVYASPAVTGGRIYFGTIGGIMYCFNAASGGSGPLWTFDAGAAIDAAPVEINGKIVFPTENMKAYALDEVSGTKLWEYALPGARTWNGHPVASSSLNRVFMTMIVQFSEPTSTYRSVDSMGNFESNAGPLSTMLTSLDTFVGANRDQLQPTEILDAANGSPIRNFTVGGQTIVAPPMVVQYWGSTPPPLWQGNKIYFMSLWRNILIDLTNNTLYQPGSNQDQTKYPVRGDEQVPMSIGGNRAYGAQGSDIAYLDLTTGIRGNLMGSYDAGGNETPLTPPLSSSSYIMFPGDGQSDHNGAFIVAGGRAYSTEYGWVYCYNGTVVNQSSASSPAAPKNLRLR